MPINSPGEWYDGDDPGAVAHVDQSKAAAMDTLRRAEFYVLIASNDEGDGTESIFLCSNLDCYRFPPFIESLAEAHNHFLAEFVRHQLGD